MRRRRLLFSVWLMVVAIVLVFTTHEVSAQVDASVNQSSFTQLPIGAPGDGLPAARVSTSTVCNFAGFDIQAQMCVAQITGSSTLVRSRGGVTGVVDSSGIEPDTVVTLWWVIADFFGGFELIQIADGHVIGSDGSANFASHLKVGVEHVNPDGSTGTLIDPFGSIVVLLLRSHGPMVPGIVDEQITEWNGGCNPGEPNEGLCAELQISPHIPAF